MSLDLSAVVEWAKDELLNGIVIHALALIAVSLVGFILRKVIYRFLLRWIFRPSRRLLSFLGDIAIAGWQFIRMPPEVREWVGAVLKIIRRNRDGSLGGNLILKTLLTYSVEETRHVAGEARPIVETRPPRSERDAPQNRVFTSFVSYAQIVQSVVEAAEEFALSRDHDLVCFTTLNMALPQWFNNKLRHDLDRDFPFLEVDRDWNDYLNFIYSVPKVGRPRVIVHRFVQTAKSEIAGAVSLRDESEMKALANALIMLPEKIWKEPEQLWIEPMTVGKIQKTLEQIDDEETRSFISRTYVKGEIGLSHLMVPHRPALEGKKISLEGEVHEWLTVGRALRRFCGDSDGQCRVVKCGRDAWKKWYSAHDAGPNDIFLIGSCGHASGDKVGWQFALAGTPDRDCQMVRLEFGSNEFCPPRIARAFQFAKKMLEQSDKGDPDVPGMREWLNHAGN